MHVCVWMCYRKREREHEETSLTIYPVEARRGSKTEHAAKTDVMPAAVPSTVFSSKRKNKKFPCRLAH